MGSGWRKLSEVDRNGFQGQDYGLTYRQAGESSQLFFHQDQEAGGRKGKCFHESVGLGQGKKLREVHFL